MVWVSRVAKVIQFISALFIVVDIIGADRIRGTANTMREHARSPTLRRRASLLIQAVCVWAILVVFVSVFNLPPLIGAVLAVLVSVFLGSLEFGPQLYTYSLEGLAFVAENAPDWWRSASLVLLFTAFVLDILAT